MLRRGVTLLLTATLVSLSVACNATPAATRIAGASTPSLTAPPAPSSGASASTAVLAPATLTLWNNNNPTDAETPATANVIKAFEALHPGVTINMVMQPPDNYFDLLQAAAISKTGPDLASMWTGLFALKYANSLQPLNSLVPMADLLKFKGIQYSSINFVPKDGVLVVPLDEQFYDGFYNKSLFQKAGLDPSHFPQTWDELFAACAKLKAAGILPMVYGTGQLISGGFYPWYGVSYLMTIYSPAQWKGLYDGTIPWTSPAIVAQFQRWTSLYERGYTNRDVLTNSNAYSTFESGKAAMIVDGSWSIPEFEKKLGNNLGVFLPPYSETPINAVVEYSGTGYAITSYSQHKAQAAAFLSYLASDAAQNVLAASGVIPPKQGFSENDPLVGQLVAYAATLGYKRYPMIDNVIQPQVADPFGTKILNGVFAGTMSVASGLNALQGALLGLPANQRSSQYYK